MCLSVLQICNSIDEFSQNICQFQIVIRIYIIRREWNESFSQLILKKCGEETYNIGFLNLPTYNLLLKNINRQTVRILVWGKKTKNFAFFASSKLNNIKINSFISHAAFPGSIAHFFALFFPLYFVVVIYDDKKAIRHKRWRVICNEIRIKMRLFSFLAIFIASVCRRKVYRLL